MDFIGLMNFHKQMIFLAENTSRLSNYEDGNTVYIKSPHYFKPNNTYYYWFITLKHLHKESIVKFTYEYINENEDCDKGSQKGEDKSFFESIAFWIILGAIIVIIIGVLVLLLIIKKNKQKSSSKIETLVNDVPKQELI